jgi:hypothetical protein
MNKEALWIEFYKLGLSVGMKEDAPKMYDEDCEEIPSDVISEYAYAYAEMCMIDVEHKFSSPTIKTSEMLSTLKAQDIYNICLSFRHDYGIMDSRDKDNVIANVENVISAIVNTLRAKGE